MANFLKLLAIIAVLSLEVTAAFSSYGSGKISLIFLARIWFY